MTDLQGRKQKRPEPKKKTDLGATVTNLIAEKRYSTALLEISKSKLTSDQKGYFLLDIVNEAAIHGNYLVAKAAADIMRGQEQQHAYLAIATYYIEGHSDQRGGLLPCQKTFLKTLYNRQDISDLL